MLRVFLTGLIAPGLAMGLAIGLAMSTSGCMSSNGMPKAQPDRASDINLEIGIDHLRKGNLSQAKEKIDRALDQNPRNAKAHAAAGLLYDRLGETKQADNHFDRAMSLEPKDPDIGNNYAAFLCKNGRYERGEKVALQTASNPLYKTPEIALVNAGNCARAAGELGRAEEDYRRALNVKPRFNAALYELTEINLTQKNYLSARGFYQRYMEVTRTSPATLWFCVRIERGLNNASVADNCAQRLKNEFPSAPETKALLDSERNAG
jgi:type IV pilus assembly protein PilF